MCMSVPKIPAPVPPAQMQALQAPKDMTNPNGTMRDKLRRRGMWASVFTGPQGIAAAPSVTGTSGGMTGG